MVYGVDYKPKVSIIVPVYKTEKYLRECVDSLLAQAFADYEILLIDDGSPDCSGEICDEYAAKDTRVRVFHKENGGVSSARNVGLDHARGEWIAFVDSDDWVEKDFLSPLTQENIMVDAIHMGFVKEYPNKQKVLYEPKQMGVVATQDFFSIGTFMSQSVTYFFRKRIVDSCKLRFSQDIAYSEDREFIAKYLLCSRYVAQVKKTPYFYRANTESAIYKRRNYDSCLDDLRVIQHMQDFVERKRMVWLPSASSFFYSMQLDSYLFALALSCRDIPWEKVKRDMQNTLSLLPNVRFEKSQSNLYAMAVSFPALVVYGKRLKIILRQLRSKLQKKD